MNTWRPTPALVTSAAVSGGLLILAVLASNPGLVVLATPLVAITIWSILTRPTSHPRVGTIRTSRQTTEGVVQQWSARIEGLEGSESVHAATRSGAQVRCDPATGVLVATPTDGSATLTMTWAARRWGLADVGTGSCVASSAWSGFRAGPLELLPVRVRVIPAVPPFAITGGAPRPAGLIGQNRSVRRGDGSEFADLRLYQHGDRLRRIHWPISARTGQLHVRTTHAELDSEILLVLDAQEEYGDSATETGTSLDVGVRACAAMSAHLLQRGERVGLRVLSSTSAGRVRSAGGAGQLRRILHELSGVRAGALGPTGTAARHRIEGSRGTLIVVVSPVIGTVASTLAAGAAQRGLPTVLIDCLPSSTAGGDVAHRLSMLERQVQMHRLQHRGLAVVPWRGPGSLDPVLQRMGAAGVGSRRR